VSRVLVVTGGPGPDHAHDFCDPVTGTGPALVRLCIAAGHEAELTDDVESGFRRLADEPFDVVLVNALRWRMEAPQYERWRAEFAVSLSETARRAVVEFVERGGGLVGNHTASICFDDWPGWADLLGGGWVWGRSSHPRPAPVEVHVTAEHPVVAGLPTVFTLVDEVYGDQELCPGTEVLAIARRTPEDDPQPMVWVATRGQGRVVYDALGHDVASLTDPVHAQLLTQCVAWAARQPAGASA
jgi:type 1 glutamine amidotransferase